MGQEISSIQFSAKDFEHFHLKLTQETSLLERLIKQQAFSKQPPHAGFEIEAWLVDSAMQPAAINKSYLTGLNEPLASMELSKFNIEFNSTPLPLTGQVFNDMHRQLQSLWHKASHHAQSLNHHVMMIGILPTLKQSDLTLANMSEMHRYHALNEQVLQVRGGQPVRIDITGKEHLRFEHHDVMLESATTSFQTHIQIPLTKAHHFYNASIIASAAIVAVCANSPFLFGKQLWQETRIPLFEQAVEIGGYHGAAHGPMHRVSFGSNFAKHSIFEVFHENLAHFPVLLPALQNSPAEFFAHLRLHNGTIWRWNRPLIGFDADGTPHIRIEHRTPAAGPTVLDAIANAVFYYGLAQNLSDEIMQRGLPLSFAQAKDNFYQAARYGMEAVMVWFDGEKHRLDQLLQKELLPRARKGLQSLAIAPTDIDLYLEIIQERIQTKQTGSDWQRRFIKNNQNDFTAMTRQYLKNQNAGQPVSSWGI